MQNSLKSLTREELLTQTQHWVAEERNALMQLIECLTEVHRRSLPQEMGYSSLWDFARRYLGLSEGAAQRRIAAMRVSEEFPEAKAALENGTLSLSNASKLDTFFREAKKQGVEKSAEEKRQVVEEILSSRLRDGESSSPGISQKECERRLAELAPEVNLHSEKARVLSEDKTELKVVLDSSVVQMLDELRNLMAHQLPQATYAELIAVLADQGLQRIRKKRTGQAEATTFTAATAVPRPPSAPVQDTVTPSEVGVPTSKIRKSVTVAKRKQCWQRADSQCEYVASSGQRCQSRYGLEIDHRLALVQGGSDDLGNLQLLCRSHHSHKSAQESFFKGQGH